MKEILQKQIVVNDYLVNYYLLSSPESKLNVIFIHGWLSNSKVWFHLMHALGKVGISSYAIDLPGFGNSQIPKLSVDNTFYSSIVKEFSKKLNLDNIVLAGHSNGGAIAVKIVNSDNSFAEKLILVSAAGIRKKSTKKIIKNTLSVFARPFFKLKFLKPLRNRIYKIMGSEDYINSEYLMDTYKNVINEDLSDLYKKINIPTLIIWGINDNSTPFSYGEFINKEIDSSMLVKINAGHFPFIDKPDEVINSLITFLK